MSLDAVWRIVKGARVEKGRPIMSAVDQREMMAAWSRVMATETKWRDWGRIWDIKLTRIADGLDVAGRYLPEDKFKVMHISMRAVSPLKCVTIKSNCSSLVQSSRTSSALKGSCRNPLPPTGVWLLESAICYKLNNH